MNIITEYTAPANSGWAGHMKKGQVLRLTAQTIIDFVAFNSNDMAERFDQARTRVYNLNIYLTEGHKVFTKYNKHMMTMITDGFKGAGTHDLQFGMCGRNRHKRAAEEGRLDQYHHGGDIDIPDRGCWENLQSVLVDAWGVAREDIPSPLNIFQNMKIDTASGGMQHTPVRPLSLEYVEVRAEMDLVVAASACPDLAAPGGRGKDIDVMIYQP